MISWTSPKPGGGPPPTTPGPLTARPLDPLPPRMVLPPPPPGGSSLPLTARTLVVVVLLVGNPWAFGLIVDWIHELPDSGGLTGLVTGLTEMTVFALGWPRWDPRITDYGHSGYWLAQNLRTVLFVLMTVWLLRRLAAAGTAPRRAYRALATLAAPVVGAAVAAVGTTVVLVVFDNADVYGYGDDAARLVRDMLAGGLHGGFVLGVLLAVVEARWRGPATTDPPATDRR